MCSKENYTFFSFLTSYFQCTPDLDWRRGRWGLSRVNIVSCLLYVPAALARLHGGWAAVRVLPHPREQRSPSKTAGTGAAVVQHWGQFLRRYQCQGPRRRPSKMVERVESHLEPNCIPTREIGLIPCVHQTQKPHRDWNKTVFVSSEEVWVSSELL